MSTLSEVRDVQTDHERREGHDPTVVMSEARNRILHTFGNLTVLTQELNSSVSNSPWEIEAPALLQAFWPPVRRFKRAFSVSEGSRSSASSIR